MTTWHIPGELLERYLDGALGAPHVLSVEAHLAECADCRARIAVDEAWLARSWDGVEAAIDRPPAAERLLSRLGVPPQLARLLLATPALSRAWLLAVLLVLAFGVAAAHLSHGDPVVLLAFLVAAPVLPLAGIALAYGPAVDPAYELQAATPLAGPRLLFLRAGAVLAAATACTGLATPFLPGALGLSAAWLLPALALTLACLAASTRVPVHVAAIGLTAVWVAVTLSTQQLDRFLLFEGGAQVVYACAIPLLAIVVHARQGRLDPISHPRRTL
jgi:Putative zinc-finger